MKVQAFRFFKQFGFQETRGSRKHNARLGLYKQLDLHHLHVEIVNRIWGFSIQIYGGHFQKDYYPTNFDVCCSEDLSPVITKITEGIKSELYPS